MTKKYKKEPGRWITYHGRRVFIPASKKVKQKREGKGKASVPKQKKQSYGEWLDELNKIRALSGKVEVRTKHTWRGYLKGLTPKEYITSRESR